MNASLKEVIDSLTIKGFALKIKNPEIDNPIAVIFLDENDQSHSYLIRFNVDGILTSDGTWINKGSRDLVLNNLLLLHFLRTLNELPSLKEKVASTHTGTMQASNWHASMPRCPVRARSGRLALPKNSPISSFSSWAFLVFPSRSPIAITLQIAAGVAVLLTVAV
jgi:hypothetical protein